jgi:hypothetical protein
LSPLNFHFIYFGRNKFKRGIKKAYFNVSKDAR